MMNSTRSQTLWRIEQASKTNETELKRIIRVAAWQKHVRTLQQDRLKLELAAAQQSLIKTKRLASRLESTVRARQKTVKTLEQNAARQEKQLRTNDASSFVFLIVVCWFIFTVFFDCFLDAYLQMLTFCIWKIWFSNYVRSWRRRNPTWQMLLRQMRQMLHMMQPRPTSRLGSP